jgi:hypothetical protein
MSKTHGKKASVETSGKKIKTAATVSVAITIILLSLVLTNIQFVEKMHSRNFMSAVAITQGQWVLSNTGIKTSVRYESPIKEEKFPPTLLVADWDAAVTVGTYYEIVFDDLTEQIVQRIYIAKKDIPNTIQSLNTNSELADELKNNIDDKGYLLYKRVLLQRVENLETVLNPAQPWQNDPLEFLRIRPTEKQTLLFKFKTQVAKQYLENTSWLNRQTEILVTTSIISGITSAILIIIFLIAFLNKRSQDKKLLINISEEVILPIAVETIPTPVVIKPVMQEKEKAPKKEIPACVTSPCAKPVPFYKYGKAESRYQNLVESLPETYFDQNKAQATISAGKLYELAEEKFSTQEYNTAYAYLQQAIALLESSLK